MKASYYDLKLEEINLRMHQVRSLKELRIAPGVFNTEALMLILNKKYRASDGSRMLLKYLDAQDEKDIMNRKEKTLAYLNGSEYKKLDDLVIPEYIVYVDGSSAGFAMPLIENHRNLGAILHSDRIPFKTKLYYLKELGMLIDRVERVEDKHNFSFGDLNEFNFIIDKNNRLRAIDLDSSYVEGLEGVDPPVLAYYLLGNHSLLDITDKYHIKDEIKIIPSKSTDIYSYCMIILSILSGVSFHKLDMNTYYQYLEYLNNLGIPEELLKIFFNIYTPRPNKNPYKYLDELSPKIYRKTNFDVFQQNNPYLKRLF